MRIAIVNDLGLAVEALRRCLGTVPTYEVAWIARDGAEAVRKCAADTPDLILMDLIMPEMDGVGATRAIMASTPCPILIVTATVSGNFSRVYDAMGCGALDAVNTPSLGPAGRSEGADALLRKIAQVALLVSYNRSSPTPAPPGLTGSHRANLPPTVVIGASTGGPQAVADVLADLPADFPAAVTVVQHMDAEFIPGFASWLRERTPLSVTLAEEHGRPRVGEVVVAGRNDHLYLRPDGTFHYDAEPRQEPFRPSVDVFFSSLAQLRPARAVGVLLTGMGRDGAKGLLALREAGAYTIAQDEHTSVIYGMPKAATLLGAAQDLLPLDRIAQALTRFFASTELQPPKPL